MTDLQAHLATVSPLELTKSELSSKLVDNYSKNNSTYQTLTLHEEIDDRPSLMSFLNQVAKVSYEKQEERFKSLIDKENRYLAFFVGLVTMPRHLVKQ